MQRTFCSLGVNCPAAPRTLAIGTMRVWDITTQRCVGTLTGHTESVTCACVLPGLAYPALLSGSLDSSLRIWDLNHFSQARQLEGHTQPVVSVAYIGGGRAASGSCLGTLRVWSVADGSCVRRLKGHMARARPCVSSLLRTRSSYVLSSLNRAPRLHRAP